jgi:hypothetical protein
VARYLTTISSRLGQDEAFAYLADFSNALAWDPSVTSAVRLEAGTIGVGSAFSLVARFAGRSVPLRYAIVVHDAPRLVVLEAQRPGFLSRDTITVTATDHGTVVRYDALLSFNGLGRLADPVVQMVFNRVGAGATGGLTRALNPAP